MKIVHSRLITKIRMVMTSLFAITALQTAAIGEDANPKSTSVTSKQQIMAEINPELELKMLKQLRAQGADPSAMTGYSVYFKLDMKSTAVMQSDWNVTYPDVFVVVSIEGEGDFLIPKVEDEYVGQPIQLAFLHHKIPSGRRVLVHIYDDDSLLNDLLNRIAQTKINYRLGTGVPFMKLIGGEVSGTFQITDKNYVLNANDHIGTFEFFMPDFELGRHAISGKLIYGKNQTVGMAEFVQVWTPSPEIVRQESRSHFMGVLGTWTGSFGILSAFAVLAYKGAKRWKRSAKTPSSPSTSPTPPVIVPPSSGRVPPIIK
jgi:hypothetical protein